MPQRMGAQMGGVDPQGLEVGASQVVQGTAGEGTDRRDQGEKDGAVATGRADVPDIAQQGIADGRDQRVELRAVPFGACDPQQVMVPIEVVKAQLRDLTGPQAVDGKQHQHGAIPYVARAGGLEALQQAVDLGPRRAELQRLARDATGAVNSRGERRWTPALDGAVAKEAAERGGHIVDGRATPPLGAALAQKGIDIGEVDRGERPSPTTIPTQKLTKIPPGLFNGGGS